jgi:hypothetical protein
VHKEDNSTKEVKELFLVKLLWQTVGQLHPLVVVHPPSHISSLLWQSVIPRCVLVLRSFHSLKRRENEITTCYHRFKLDAINLTSKHKLKFCTALAFQNVLNNFSKSKTHGAMANHMLDVKIN